ncbi:MAG TPA: MaoC family dehydratase [Acidobacteriota bacterium]|nr:MaoC family dehydratase [Acidobacteriota bacterium]
MEEPQSIEKLVVENIQELKKYVGHDIALTSYYQIDQSRVDQFATLTEDRQWIHTDVERARRESPHGGTIAHGFLTLSLLNHFLLQAVEVKNVRLGLNYGLNSVRFPAIVPTGAKIRAQVRLLSVEDVTGGIQAVWKFTITCQGNEKPSCVAEWVVRYYE